MEPLRLLALSSTGEVSGAERVLLRVLTMAAESGWQVTLAAPRGPLLEGLSAKGIAVVDVPELGLAPGGRPLAVVRTIARWGRAARRVRRAARDADLMLVNSLVALPVARLSRVRVPVVWHAHDVVVRRDRLRLYRLCRPALTLVVGVSAAVVERLRHDGVRMEVVHNGVPWPVEPADGHQDPTRRVVGIGALLTPWKGHQVLLDAVPSLPPDVRVEVMGGHRPKDEEYAAHLRRRAADSASGGRVDIVGHVADPLARMRTWTVAVSASTDPEACGLNVLEAMSIGVPVVATAHGGTPETLGGGGLLVPPGDARALADAIKELLENPGLREQLARSGQERVAAGHQVQVQTRRLLDLLAEVAAR